MSRPTTPRTQLPAPRGAVTWVSVLMTVALAAAAYLGWVWAPIYLDHYALRQAARSTMNAAIKNPDDAAIVADFVRKVRAIRTVDGVDEITGRPARVPAIALTDRQVTVSRDREAKPPVIRLQVEYEREVEYPFLHRTATKTFLYDETGDLSPVDWSR